MPINVFKITKLRSSISIEPGLNIEVATGYKSDQLRISEISENSYHRGPIVRPFNSVYLVSEIDNKVSEINNKLNSTKDEFSSQISKSLEEIQKQIISLKEQIIKDQAFIENIADSLTNNETFLDKIKEKLQS